MRKPFIAGNWKMNLNLKEAINLVNQLKREFIDFQDVEIAVCPPFVYLPDVCDQLAESPISVGAQNVHWEEKGAFTGEISTAMLRDVGCKYAIVGHSERRHIFGETDEVINKKVKAVLNSGLSPILCVGELLEERKKGVTKDIVLTQLKNGLAGISPDEVTRITIAYEPVWAIGTGETATPEIANEAHTFIREFLDREYGAGKSMRIQYGGSVKPENVAGLMEMEGIDGGLVGGASLEAESFIKIVRYR